MGGEDESVPFGPSIALSARDVPNDDADSTHELAAKILLEEPTAPSESGNEPVLTESETTTTTRTKTPGTNRKKMSHAVKENEDNHAHDDKENAPKTPLGQKKPLTDIDGNTLEVAGVQDITIEKPPIETAQQFLELCETASGMLQNEDWVTQVRGLRTVRYMVVECHAHKFEEFEQGYEIMKSAFDTCASSLRSAIVKEACLILTEIATECGFRFTPFASFHFPALMKMCVVTKRVMSTAASQCMSNLVELCDPTQMVPAVCTTQNIEGWQTREILAGCLLTIIQEHDSAAISPLIPQICDALVRFLQDSKPKVRTAATTTYKVIVVKFPESRDLILPNLDASTQKRLEPKGNVKKIMTAQLRTQYLTLFANLDHNHEGKVSVEDLVAALPLSEEDANTFVTTADVNADGFVDLAEFTTVMEAVDNTNTGAALAAKLLSMKMTRRTTHKTAPEDETPGTPKPQRSGSLIASLVTPRLASLVPSFMTNSQKSIKSQSLSHSQSLVASNSNLVDDIDEKPTSSNNNNNNNDDQGKGDNLTKVTEEDPANSNNDNPKASTDDGVFSVPVHPAHKTPTPADDSTEKDTNKTNDDSNDINDDSTSKTDNASKTEAADTTDIAENQGSNKDDTNDNSANHNNDDETMPIIVVDQSHSSTELQTSQATKEEPQQQPEAKVLFSGMVREHVQSTCFPKRTKKFLKVTQIEGNTTGTFYRDQQMAHPIETIDFSEVHIRQQNIKIAIRTNNSESRVLFFNSKLAANTFANSGIVTTK